MIAPIILYGCEIWGYENLEIIERLHLKFLKFASGLRKSTPNFMVYGELGRVPLKIKVYKHMIGFWYKLVNQKDVLTLSQRVYNYLELDTNVNNYENTWLNCIKNILDGCGLSDIFYNPINVNRNWLISKVEQTLTDQFFQDWRSKVESSSKGNLYKFLKNNVSFEKYLLLDKSISLPILKCRTYNHNLPVETGRWANIVKEERTCTLCNSPFIADEFHYIFRCEYFIPQRKHYIAEKYYTFPNIPKLCRLLNSNVMKERKDLSTFLKYVYRTVNEKTYTLSS
jgi:hypothetical protein